MQRHLLVIGGMKCGSTTLYHDLQVSMPVHLARKESDLLLEPSHDGLRKRYEHEFRAAPADAMRGDVSTSYTKRPDVPCVAARAIEHFGPDTKLIYIVRDPVQRAISHHHHMHSWRGPGHMEADIDDCIRKYPSLINYSRYAWQLEPWLDHFPLSSIRVVRFEDYVADRPHVLKSLGEFLQVPVTTTAIDPGKVHNASDQKPVLTRGMSQLMGSRVYQRLVRDRLPRGLTSAVRSALLPKAPSRPREPSPETVNRIRDAVREDAETLQRWFGAMAPRWPSLEPAEAETAAA